MTAPEREKAFEACSGAEVSIITMNEFLAEEAVHARRRQAAFFSGSESADGLHDRFADGQWGVAHGSWAIALSGGGIRSATFSLGVLQALAKPKPAALAAMPPASWRQMAGAKVKGPLALFDYISSVSGGGFTAGALHSLFVPRGDIVPGLSSVYTQIEQEPPPRVHQGVKPSPLAWLRENGRYLAPSGAGDMAYVIGMSIRNWLGVQWLIGAPVVFLVALLAIFGNQIVILLPRSLQTWWAAPVAVFLVWVMPCAGAYWMTRIAPEQFDGVGLPVIRTIVVGFAGIVFLLCGLVPWFDQHEGWWQTPAHEAVHYAGAWTLHAFCCGLLLLLTVGWAVIVRFSGTGRAPRVRRARAGAARLRKQFATGLTPDPASLPTNVSSQIRKELRRIWRRLCIVAHRNKTGQALAVALTRWYTRGMKVVALLLAVALVLDLSRCLLANKIDHPIMTAGGVAGVLSFAYRAVMKVLPMVRGVGSSTSEKPVAPTRLLGVALGVLGVVLVLAVALFWTTATFWLMVPRGLVPSTQCEIIPGIWQHRIDTCIAPENAIGLVVLVGLFILVAGRWMSILNMSGYHFFYSSRLTRAYLGASNPQRTTACSVNSNRTTGTADPAQGDSIAYAEYHKNPAAPIHLINTTLNQTVDSAEQLVQRDRKGQSFVVLPYFGGTQRAVSTPSSLNVSIGGKFMRIDGPGRSLSIGDWLAVSGAAVSTGLGRQTSPGAAICVTMANARVGRWWPGRGDRDRGFRAWLPTYYYLFDELRAKFHGAQRQYLYLTDGGHFENTATYELVRRIKHRDTRIRFIVMCDCGADEKYQYDQMANLVRLARVDFGLEIKVNLAAASTDGLAKVFGTPENMGPADPNQLDERCAILLDVFDETILLARIVVIKPRLISCVSSDLLAYYRSNPTFPQQSTANQFFDDEQWESYRKLGLECCHAVLNLGEPLWTMALKV